MADELTKIEIIKWGEVMQKWLKIVNMPSLEQILSLTESEQPRKSMLEKVLIQPTPLVTSDILQSPNLEKIKITQLGGRVTVFKMEGKLHKAVLVEGLG
ncbi:pentatricopeptide repeat-containing protein [Corchorus olitorius]|uniref:Pentatricopeptide repeat-containing protein n=1 Tax=Corchorus olitorius TaxID=93759 RepID=A0A1R3HML7_9ROSI|nr:pentatricopeptide repeat-containing protein [Corchorus olitorius]